MEWFEKEDLDFDFELKPDNDGGIIIIYNNYYTKWMF
jgi:hypothetical protein